MTIERHKLWQNKYFDIRSYELEKATKKKQNICCFYKGKRMTLTPDDQRKRRLLLNKTPYPSKVNLGQTYLIYSFLFQPDKELPKLTEEEELKKLAQLGVFG